MVYTRGRLRRDVRRPHQEVVITGSVLAIDGVVYDNMEVKIRGGGHARNNLDKQGLSFDFASGVEALVPDVAGYPFDEFALSSERGWHFGRQLREALLARRGLPTSQPAAPEIVISELVHSPESGPDWLELRNPTRRSVDLSGWTIDGVDGLLPEGTILLAGGYLVVTRDIPEFEAEYPGLSNVVIVEMDGGLSGSVELIELITNTGVVVDSVNYGLSLIHI